VAEITAPRWLKDGSGFLWTSDEGSAGTNTFTRTEIRNADGTLRRVLLDGTTDSNVVAIMPDQQSVLVNTSNGLLDASFTRQWLDAGRAIEPIAKTTGGTFISLSMAEEAPTVVRSMTKADGSIAWHVFKDLSNVGNFDASPAKGTGPVAELKSIAVPLPAANVPKIEVTTVTVGGVEMNAMLIRPKTLTPGTKYPVLNRVYGGPAHRQVSARVRSYVLDQWLADEGFIIVSIDARGTPGRGYAFERVIKGDLITAPLADQAGAMIELCKKYPELDAQRIGIFGWSFGGYFACHATMQRPDVFKAGCAGGSVADWRDYDTHYTERYMGMPQERAEAYDKTSVLTYAKDLRVPLLLIHGTSDDNVYFFHTLKIADALFRAGKKYELLPLAGFTHSVYEPEAVKAMWSRIVGFFQQNLGK